MKVTESMIVAAADVMACSPQSTWVDMARKALEAALADVPERSIDAATVALRHVREEIPEAFLREHDGYIFAAVAGMAARIAELEAQLQRALSEPTDAEYAAATEALAQSYQYGGGTDEVMAVAAVNGFLRARKA